ncbi:hemolysin/hemagglutinin-like protein [Pectobacterium atrosepticum]|nr:hemolysin/hemagglutinin-like protein [Pectobacterium atrosepticum]
MKPIKTTQRLLAYTLIHFIAFQPLLCSAPFFFA